MWAAQADRWPMRWKRSGERCKSSSRTPLPPRAASHRRRDSNTQGSRMDSYLKPHLPEWSRMSPPSAKNGIATPGRKRLRGSRRTVASTPRIIGGDSISFFSANGERSMTTCLSTRSPCVKTRGAVALITRLINLEIEESPDTTSGPIDILEMDGSGSHWLARKVGCESPR